MFESTSCVKENAMSRVRVLIRLSTFAVASLALTLPAYGQSGGQRAGRSGTQGQCQKGQTGIGMGMTNGMQTPMGGYGMQLQYPYGQMGGFQSPFAQYGNMQNMMGPAYGMQNLTPQQLAKMQSLMQQMQAILQQNAIAQQNLQLQTNGQQNVNPFQQAFQPNAIAQQNVNPFQQAFGNANPNANAPAAGLRANALQRK
jgi:hypothetical protein